MRAFKVIAIAVGVLIAFLFVGTVVGFLIHAVIDLVIAAAVVGGIVIAIKMARSNKQVSRGRKESEVQDSYTPPLPRADVQQYSQPTRSQYGSQDVDDELARLKREMGS
jgi:hypothetical protein